MMKSTCNSCLQQLLTETEKPLRSNSGNWGTHSPLSATLLHELSGPRRRAIIYAAQSGICGQPRCLFGRVSGCPYFSARGGGKFPSTLRAAPLLARSTCFSTGLLLCLPLSFSLFTLRSVLCGHHGVLAHLRRICHWIDRQCPSDPADTKRAAQKVAPTNVLY